MDGEAPYDVMRIVPILGYRLQISLRNDKRGKSIRHITLAYDSPDYI